MTNDEKLAEIRILMFEWAYLRDKMGNASYQNDLTKIQYIVYSAVVQALEEIFEN